MQETFCKPNFAIPNLYVLLQRHDARIPPVAIWQKLKSLDTADSTAQAEPFLRKFTVCMSVNTYNNGSIHLFLGYQTRSRKWAIACALELGSMLRFLHLLHWEMWTSHYLIVLVRVLGIVNVNVNDIVGFPLLDFQSPRRSQHSLLMWPYWYWRLVQRCLSLIIYLWII